MWIQRPFDKKPLSDFGYTNHHWNWAAVPQDAEIAVQPKKWSGIQDKNKWKRNWAASGSFWTKTSNKSKVVLYISGKKVQKPSNTQQCWRAQQDVHLVLLNVRKKVLVLKNWICSFPSKKQKLDQCCQYIVALKATEKLRGIKNGIKLSKKHSM